MDQLMSLRIVVGWTCSIDKLQFKCGLKKKGTKAQLFKKKS